MFGGVAVADPYDIAEGQHIRERIRNRDGRPEMYFFLTDPERVLPVYLGGGTRIVRWGGRRANGDRFPLSAWLQLADLATGKLLALEPEEVIVRANRAVDNGIWYDVAVGVRAVLIRSAHGSPVVYPLVEQASHYYLTMTGSKLMPCLVRQRI
jgi:hypothetical protein